MSDTKKIVLIAFHKNCIDGFTSVAIARKALITKGYEVDTLAMQYSEASEINLKDQMHSKQYDELFVVDFSLSTTCMIDITNGFPWVKCYILDHHKTAFEHYCPQVEITPTVKFTGGVAGFQIYLDNNESGASLCWKFFNPGAEVPPLVQYVRDYDLWKFEHKHTKAVNAILNEANQSFDYWDELMRSLGYDSGYTNYLTAKGNLILDIAARKVAELAETAQAITIAGKVGLAVTGTEPKLTNDLGHAMCKASGTFGAVISIDLNRQVIKFSLRSEGDYDVSAITKLYGGGGHKNAGGFEVPLLQEVSDDCN